MHDYYAYAQCRSSPKHSPTEQGQLKTVIIVLDKPEADWHNIKMFPETLN